jgi:hypothetical protein
MVCNTESFYVLYFSCQNKNLQKKTKNTNFLQNTQKRDILKEWHYFNFL